MTKKITSIEDLLPEKNNANRGTERGRTTIRNSMEKRGTGRSVVVDADGNIIAGNNATRVARELGKKIILVPTTGDELIVHQRTDLVAGSDEAKLLAIDDNRAGQLGTDWDPDVLSDDLENGLDLGDAGFEEAELDDILAAAAEVAFEDVDGDGSDADSIQRKQGPVVKVAMQCEDVTLFEEAMAATGKTQRGEALMVICRAYLDRDEEIDV